LTSATEKSLSECHRYLMIAWLEYDVTDLVDVI